MSGELEFEREVISRLGHILETLEGIGLELEAIKIITRAAAIEKIGRDPLRGTYHDDELPDPPDWING